MIYAVTLLGSILAYALAIHLGAPEGIASLVLIVVLAETIMSWAFSKELEKQEYIAIKNQPKRA